jgi:hypothetical protein
MTFTGVRPPMLIVLPSSKALPVAHINLTAYDFFLRSMEQYYLTTRESLAEAIRLAHRALELDPRFGWQVTVMRATSV